MRRFLTAVAALCLLGGGLSMPAWSATIYVDQNASGNGNGTSWVDAFTTVQEGLDAAQNGDEVWVAEGEYVENLTVAKALSLYGGFTGDETSADDRDLQSYSTVLNGDGERSVLVSTPPAILRLDGFTIVAGNAPEHGGGARLEGFTGTVANVKFSNNTAGGNGGGLYIQSDGNADDATITLENLIFDGNFAGNGGGLYLGSLDNTAKVEIQIRDSEFSGNFADVHGGGLYVDAALQPDVTDENITVKSFVEYATFDSNGAEEGGGAYFTRSVNPNSYRWETMAVIDSSTFERNHATRGGGMAVHCEMDVFYSTFQDNVARPNDMDAAGGGLYVADWCTVFLDSSEVNFNRVEADAGFHAMGGGAAGLNGGSLYAYSSYFRANEAGNGAGTYVEGGSFTAYQSGFMNNAASEIGGGVLIRNTGSYRLESCLFDSNMAAEGGAVALDNVALRFQYRYLPEIRNNTMVNNTAPLGAGLSATGGSVALVYNNIVVGNTSGLRAVADSRLLLSTNDVFGNGSGADYQGVPNPTGTFGNISADPLFVNADAGTYRLAAGSPARDAGNNADYRHWNRDYVDSPRVQGLAVDMGAYESAGAPALFLEFETEPDTRSGVGALTPQPVVKVLDSNGNLQTAFSGSVTLSLAPGFGTPGANLGGTVTVPVTDGRATFTDLNLDKAGVGFRLVASLPGSSGFWGLPFSITLPRVYVSPNGSDTNSGNSWTNARKTPAMAVDLVSPGGALWLRAGTYTGALEVNGVSILGGFAGTETDAAQRNLTANITVLDGTGETDVINVQGNADQPILFDGLHIQNGGGAGILNFVSDATISHNVITNCGAGFGGGVLTFGDNVVISHNRIVANHAVYAGGGIYAMGQTTMANNLIAGNSAPQDGAAITVYTGAGVTIANNTITGNVGANGAVHLQNSPATLANNIIAFNGSGIARSNDSTATVTLTKNLVSGNTAFNYQNVASGVNDVSADPLFVNAASGDYRLKPASPAIDAGDDAFLTLAGLDLAGNPRKSGAHVDIGAYEWLAGGPSIGDAISAMKIAGGLLATSSSDMATLNVENTGTSQNRIDTLDALRLLRDAVAIP